MTSTMSAVAVSTQAHLWITYGWLGVCALALVVVVLTIWATSIHYSSRKRWRTLDVLLAATLLQELPNALVVLVIGAIKSAFIHLPRHLQSHGALCYFLVWGSTSIRFYQFAIVTSLIADRAMILRWPYQYRFTVRHSQIRFYLVGLAIVASLVGTYAIFGHQQYIDSLTKQQTDVTEWNVTEPLNLQSPNGSIASPAIYRFTLDPSTFECHFNYFFVSTYVLFTIVCVVSFLYVECTRPRSTPSAGCSKNRGYLPSIATLFTTATTSSTATSSSTSSSLSASSPLPSRFSSLANLTNVTPNNSSDTNGKSAGQSSLPSYYYPNSKRDHAQVSTPVGRNGTETLNSLYPISIVDMIGHESRQIESSTYTSMTTTDNSIYRLIDGPNSNSRSNSLNQINESKSMESQIVSPGYQHRSNMTNHFNQSDPSSSLDPLNPTLRANSFSKARHFSSQLKLNTSNSNDSYATHRSAFDLRWSSVVGPVTFCFAFNHGPFLVGVTV